MPQARILHRVATYTLLICIIALLLLDLFAPSKVFRGAREAQQATNDARRVVDSIKKENVALVDSIAVLSARIDTFKLNIKRQTDENHQNKERISRLLRDGLNDFQRDSLIRAINASK